MAKSIIVYGFPESGLRFGKRIADHFGLFFVSAKGDQLLLPEGYLYPRKASTPLGNDVCKERSFQSVADEINASIPLTDWQSGPPPMVGEWNASWSKSAKTRRWWNGEYWSCAYQDNYSQEEKKFQASVQYFFDDLCWRGLSQEPIKVTE